MAVTKETRRALYQRALLSEVLENWPKSRHIDEPTIAEAIRKVPLAREALEHLQKSSAAKKQHSGAVPFATAGPKPKDEGRKSE